VVNVDAPEGQAVPVPNFALSCYYCQGISIMQLVITYIQIQFKAISTCGVVLYLNLNFF
jgi:hypothetical protein